MSRQGRRSIVRVAGRQACGAAVGLVVLAAMAAGGDTPWKSKPYQQWDDNDVHRVLFESPWVRIGMVQATWQTSRDADTHGLPAGSAPPAANSGGSAPSSQNQAASGGMLSGAEVGSQRGEVPTVQYFVDWVSSKTMRAARARYDVLHSGKTAADAEQYVNEPQKYYVILVQGGDMTPFLKNDEEFFRTNSSLNLKKAKQELSPERVQIQEDSAASRVSGVLFFFAKSLPSGAPLVIPEEKSIEFRCKLGRSTLKASFEPQKMATGTGEDL